MQHFRRLCHFLCFLKLRGLAFSPVRAVRVIACDYVIIMYFFAPRDAPSDIKRMQMERTHPTQEKRHCQPVAIGLQTLTREWGEAIEIVPTAKPHQRAKAPDGGYCTPYRPRPSLINRPLSRNRPAEMTFGESSNTNASTQQSRSWT